MEPHIVQRPTIVRLIQLHGRDMTHGEDGFELAQSLIFGRREDLFRLDYPASGEVFVNLRSVERMQNLTR
jgi:hypothetical protein